MRWAFVEEAECVDAIVGIHVYTTRSPGIGGRLRVQPEDFIVQEIGPDGRVAPLEPIGETYPDERGKFTEFFLVKRNLDTIQAIRLLSRKLRISYKRFSYAGMKDRRAVTSQRVTLYRGRPQDLDGLEVGGVRVLHPHQVSKPVVPGALWGNRFHIVIRDLEVEPEEAVHRMEAVKREFEKLGGILNFFGHQRFGALRPTTHFVGKHILLGNLEEAIRIILDKPPLGSLGDIICDPLWGAREISWTERVRKLPYHLFYEVAMARYLAKHPGDYRGSLRAIPKDIARLFIHAYQAYLFNRAVSERVRRGLPLNRPCVGDFVMPATGEIYAVRMVTEENLARAVEEVQRGLKKLVIPVIGYDFEHITFCGPMGEILNDLLEEEQINPSQFRLRHIPALSSRGTFRPILVQPFSLQYTLLKEKDSKVEEERKTEGFPAVAISFDLPKGSYATIVLREFMKTRLAGRL